MDWGGGKQQRAATWFLCAVCGMRGSALTLRVIIPMQQKLQSEWNAWISTISPFCTCFSGHRVDIVQIRDKITCGSASLCSLSPSAEWDTWTFAYRNGDCEGLYSRSLSVIRLFALLFTHTDAHTHTHTHTQRYLRVIAQRTFLTPVCVICYYAVQWAFHLLRTYCEELCSSRFFDTTSFLQQHGWQIEARQEMPVQAGEGAEVAGGRKQRRPQPRPQLLLLRQGGTQSGEGRRLPAR